ncbi:MAG: hypothetical protein ABUL60_07215 [Myxococcales bacterium]
MKAYRGWRAVLAASIWLLSCGNTTRNEAPGAAGSTDGIDGTGGTAGTAGSGGTDGRGGIDGMPMPSCEDARFDAESGIETCGKGEQQFQHRVRPGAGCSYDAALDTCNLSDCAAPHAHCAEQDGKSVCVPGCVVDADCQQREICECEGNGRGGQCVQSDCQSDADCREGVRCSTFRSVCSIDVAFACAVPGEMCLIDAHCPAETPYCLPIPNPDGGGWHHLCVEALPCPE